MDVIETSELRRVMPSEPVPETGVALRDRVVHVDGEALGFVRRIGYEGGTEELLQRNGRSQTESVVTGGVVVWFVPTPPLGPPGCSSSS